MWVLEPIPADRVHPEQGAGRFRVNKTLKERGRENTAVGNAIYLQFFNNIIPQIKMQCYRNIHQILI